MKEKEAADKGQTNAISDPGDAVLAEIQAIVESPQYRELKQRVEKGEPYTVEDIALIVEINRLQGQLVDEPVLFKSKKDPPTTDEEKAMWEWWNTMNQLDPNFRYRRAINFYGKVIDDSGSPIEGATARVEITAGWKKDVEVLLSDKDGLFKVEGRTGKDCSVQLSKDGYLSDSKSRGNYEYADYFTDFFHTPIEADPVVFVLRKR